MPPELATPVHSEVPHEWQTALVRLTALAAALVLLFLAEWSEMASLWWNGSTFNHILVVPGIVAWLVAIRAPQLVRLAPEPWWPGTALFALAALGWVGGSVADVNLLRHASVVAMLAASVVAVLGARVSTGLAFPLGYLAFLVPFGDEIVPPMQALTASMVVTLTEWSGVPVRSDGILIHTPAGLFRVAEACAGVTFLVAMVAFGALAAHLCFRSWRRRAAFLALCVVVPVLANAVRAWATIYLAQYVGAGRAGGVDHIVYGWVFFGVVIALVLGLSRRFFDRRADDPLIDAEGIAASPMLAHLSRLRIAPNAAIAAIGALALAARAL
jgi:exosortase A